MKLGILLAGRRPEDIAKRLEQAREAGFSLCQLNLHQSGITRAELMQVADSLVEFGVRAVAVGCYCNPLQPDDASLMGACRADLDTVLHALDVLGARRVVLWSGTLSDDVNGEHALNQTASSESVLREFLSDVVRTTQARRYTLVIEPWRSHVLGTEQQTRRFHDSLPPEVRERVRFVLDVPNLLTPDRHARRDEHVRTICSSLGELAGVVHLKDIIVPPDGEESLAAPGQGSLDYRAYLQAIFDCAAPDAPAIIRNAPPSEYGAIRDYLLRMSDRWELA